MQEQYFSCDSFASFENRNRRSIVLCTTRCRCLCCMHNRLIPSLPIAMKYIYSRVYCSLVAFDIIVEFVCRCFFFPCFIFAFSFFFLCFLIRIQYQLRFFFLHFIFKFFSFRFHETKMPITCSRYNLEKPFVSIHLGQVAEEVLGKCICVVPIYYLHHLFLSSAIALAFALALTFRGCYLPIQFQQKNSKDNDNKMWMYRFRFARIFYYAAELVSGAHKNTVKTIAIIQCSQCTLNVFYRV